MIHKTGDLFTSDAPYLGHGVNCQGVMGAGIAKTFRDRFPNNYKMYKDKCDAGQLVPGDFCVMPERMDGAGRSLRMVTNFATQRNPGADATYNNVFNSFRSFANLACLTSRLTRFGNRIAIPQIGCGIGGLEWDGVETIIKTVELLQPKIEWEVWTYGG